MNTAPASVRGGPRGVCQRRGPSKPIGTRACAAVAPADRTDPRGG